MATMNVSSTDTTSQVDIAREVASAIADDASCEQIGNGKDFKSTSLSEQDLPQPVNFVSSESGSFVRISTSSEDVAKQAPGQAGSGTAAVTVNFGEESSLLQDSGQRTSGDSTSGGSEGSKGVWGWISSAVGGDIVETTQRLGRNLVQKTKNSMDSVITTLDPGMEDYLHKSGADSIQVMVTSVDEDIIDGVKDGFKQVFEHVSVRNQQSRSSLAPLPNSFSSALKSAKQRITNLQSSPPEVGAVVVAVEEFMVEIMPEMWFGMMCLCLHDSSRKLETETFSQAIALPNDVVKRLEGLTPSHYSLRWSGLSVSLVEVLQNNWTKFLADVPKRQVVTLAAKTLAGQYKEVLLRSSSMMAKSITL